jgi:protein-S-isoprenylcysteine O-methyltransferase Ste14
MQEKFYSFELLRKRMNTGSRMKKKLPAGNILFKLGALFAGLVIFLGLPMLAWGIDDISGFFADPARILYVPEIFLLQLFGVLYSNNSTKKMADPKRGIEKHRIDLLFIQLLSLGIVFVAPYTDKHQIAILHVSDTVRMVGLICIIPGFILMQMAEKHLGKQFSVEVTVQKNHRLVTTGPFQIIRHPRYLGIIVMFVGISLVFRSLLAMFIVFALSLVLIWRIAVEESLMLQEFGQAWKDYCEKSWRIIPFVL